MLQHTSMMDCRGQDERSSSIATKQWTTSQWKDKTPFVITHWSTAALYKHLALIQQRKKIQLLEKNIRLKLNSTEFGNTALY
jgi:hypothetical protein